MDLIQIGGSQDPFEGLTPICETIEFVKLSIQMGLSTIWLCPERLGVHVAGVEQN